MEMCLVYISCASCVLAAMPHFRVDAKSAVGGESESGAPFCLFEFASVWGVV